MKKWNKAKGEWETVTTTQMLGATTFDFEFADDGIYRLEEIDTPDGYNTMSPNPIDIQVTAEHDMDGIKSLTATVGTFNTESGDFAASAAGEGLTFTVNTTAPSGDFGTYGQAQTDVVNKKGATLPETSGIGTTIFYVVGSVLVLGAVILLVTKRRMSSK